MNGISRKNVKYPSLDPNKGRSLKAKKLKKNFDKKTRKKNVEVNFTAIENSFVSK